MKTPLRLAVLSLVVFALALPAGAEGLRGKIPFDFVVMNREMPAGDYTVTLDQFGHRVLLDNGFDQRSYVLTMTSRLQTGEPAGLTLVFHRYGDRYFLRQVNCASSAVEVAPSREEKWVKRAANENRGARMALVRIALR